jgi:magnesium transporter
VTVRAWLFDAEGEDQEVDPSRDAVPARGADQLLWVDVDKRSEEDLARLGKIFELDPSLVAKLCREDERATLIQYPEHIHLSLHTMEAPDEDDGENTVVRPVRQALDLVAGPEWVATIHEGPVAATDRLLEGVEGETRLGALEASDFLAAIVDSIISGYHRTIEAFDREIDHLDELALRRPDDDVLGRLVDLRRRIGDVRRSLAPQREAFAPLGRPDLALHDELGKPWPELLTRLERALDSVERLRDSLLGTYDIYQGRLAQRSNEVMKVLTILSAILLPSVVLAGVMGMNFKLPLFDEGANFFLVIGTMIAMAGVILAVARWRRWM